MRTIIGAMVVAMVLGGCATKGDVQALRQDMDKQVKVLKDARAKNTKNIKNVGKRVTRLQGKVSTLHGAK